VFHKLVHDVFDASKSFFEAHLLEIIFSNFVPVLRIGLDNFGSNINILDFAGTSLFVILYEVVGSSGNGINLDCCIFVFGLCLSSTFLILSQGCVKLCIVGQPFLAESGDENGAKRSGNTNGENGHGQHFFTVLDHGSISSLFGHLDSDTTEGSLDSGFGNPSKRYESFFFHGVLRFHHGQERANPSAGEADENDCNSRSESRRVDVLELDGSTDSSEKERLAEHPNLA